MKTFNELTIEQQVKSIEFAKKTMKESLACGILATDEVLSEEEIDGLATEAAEHGTYSDEGNPTTELIEVPYRFLGGCV
jgi:hypothetical protein